MSMGSASTLKNGTHGGEKAHSPGRAIGGRLRDHRELLVRLTCVQLNHTGGRIIRNGKLRTQECDARAWALRSAPEPPLREREQERKVRHHPVDETSQR